GAAPCLSNGSPAASTSRSTMKSLKRAPTTPNRKPRAFGSPSNLRTRSSIRLAPLAVRRHVLDHLEAEPRERVHVLRLAHDPHALHAERAQDLRAGAERPQVHRMVLRRGRRFAGWAGL